MSDNVNAVVLGDHRVRHEFDGKEAVNTSADGVVRMTREAFADAEKFGAVRRATREDREAAKAEAQIAVAGEPPAAPSVEERAAAVADDAKSGRRT